MGSGYFALRKGDWKLILGDPSGGEGDGWFCSGAPCPHHGWRPSPVNLTADSVQLYDVRNDPEEMIDHAAAQPAMVAELRALLEKYNTTGLFDTSFVCGVPGKFQVGGALTPWCAVGGDRSGCTALLDHDLDHGDSPLKADDVITARGPPTLPGAGRWEVSMHDDFDSGLNASLWTKGWSWCNGTGKAPGTPQPRTQFKASDTCYFGDDNVAVADGKLVLTNRREKSHGLNYSEYNNADYGFQLFTFTGTHCALLSTASGVVNSISYGPGRGFQQVYGYFEARVQPSPGKHNLGMCPAFWLPNVNNNGDDGNCEIDVMEIPGGKIGGGGHIVHGTVHAGFASSDPNRPKIHSVHGSRTMDPGYWGDNYHNFAVLWLPGYLAWYVDGKMYFNTTQFVPDTPAYMVLDNEVGLGHLKGPDGGWAGNPKDTIFPQEMKVDHVTVWRRVEEATPLKTVTAVKTDESIAKVCDVTAAPYSAKGDGVTLNTAALQKAIDDCAGTAGAPGTVLLPTVVGVGSNGTTAYVSGALFLRSHLIVSVAPGAALRGSATLKDNATWPWTYKRIAGFMAFGHASLLNGGICKQMKPACPTGCKGQNLGDQCAEWTKLQDVTLSGGGTIDGDGTSWLQPPYVDIRPVLMHLAWIDGLVIEDLLITRPPFWTIHPVFCNNVTIRNCSVQTVGIGNGDGCDLDSTSNVLIEDCLFNTGDDCIALKSGMDADGRAVGIPTVNVTVRNTRFLQGHGCSIGSDMSGGVANAVFEDLIFKGTHSGVRIKDQRGRGGYVKNITYRNATMDGVESVLRINQFYHGGIPPTNATATPTFEQFLVQDITAKNSGGGNVICLPEFPCTGIRFERVHVEGSSFNVANVYGTAVNVTPPLKLLSGTPPPVKPAMPSPPGLADLALFSAGQDGYHTFRIPAIVQSRQEGVVLAFCEGRKLSSADHGWNDIVQKRSADNGHSWSNLTVVRGESTSSKHVVIGNPAPILDLPSGRIYMLFSRNNLEVGVLHTDDQGLTWGAVTELTETLMKPNGWTDIFTGLSAGLTLDPEGHGNRLIVCANHNGPDRDTKNQNHGRYSSSIYSDDAGSSWKAGKNVGPAGSTECNIGQTRTGVFMYSRMWNQGLGNLKTYGIASSGDGGITFPKGFSSMGITWPQPDCQGTMRMVQAVNGELCFALTAPYGNTRANLTLSYSCGYSPKVWKHDRVLWSGPSAYSAMDTSRDGSTFFVLYERGVKSAYEEIRLEQIVTGAWSTPATPTRPMETDDTGASLKTDDDTSASPLPAAASERPVLLPFVHGGPAGADAAPQPLLRWSTMFHDTMVLQQAPKRAKVWGFAARGAAVSVELDGKALGAVTAAAADGRWEAVLPPVRGALGAEHTITAAAAGQSTIALRQVLFGEVWLCAGQSNMVRPVDWANESALEVRDAAGYNDKIRLFMVGRMNSSRTPLADFLSVATWSAPNSKVKFTELA